MVEKTKPIVIIVDDTLLRRDAMAASFEGLANVQIAYRHSVSGKVWHGNAKGKRLDTLGPALVTLRHFRDQDVVRDVETSLTVFLWRQWWLGPGPTRRRAGSYLATS